LVSEPDDGIIYKKEMKRLVEQIISNHNNGCMTSRQLPFQAKVTDHGSGIKVQRSGACTEVDTLIYPLLQMSPFGIRHEEVVMKALLEEPLSDVTMHLVSPYFNPTDQYINSILKAFRGRFEILTCSPQVG